MCFGMALCAFTAGPVVRASDHSEEVVILLHAAAVVTTDDVTLSDLAELQGDAAALMGSWHMVAAPVPGETLVLELADIQKSLACRGVNLSQWMFRGSSRCTVTRPAGTALSDGKFEAASSSDPGRGIQDARLSAAETSRWDPNSLEGILRTHIGHRLAQRAGIEGKPIIRFSPTSGNVLALSRPTYEFEVVERGDRLLGLIAFEVQVLEGGQVARTVPVLAQVTFAAQVVAAARAINRGETIRPGDLIIEERIFDRLEDVGLPDTQPLIGQRARRFVDQRAMLTARDIEPVPLVIRNDLVTVVARRGGIVVRGTAKASSSGGIGEAVLLRNELSRESFSGIVIGPRTVELPDQRRGSPDIHSDENPLPLPLPVSTALAQRES
jgi:flagella basal body P-ring formation protein FlgA